MKRAQLLHFLLNAPRIGGFGLDDNSKGRQWLLLPTQRLHKSIGLRLEEPYVRNVLLQRETLISKHTSGLGESAQIMFRRRQKPDDICPLCEAAP
jgi:hypothetical protein